MANPEHVAKLKEDVGAWNARQTEHPDVQPDLLGADLKNAYPKRVPSLHAAA